ncbi:hypothetical protein QL285_067193 [Trifolium repens]|nr:hypothetical protein QL285_067193 [Trifolium repens]
MMESSMKAIKWTPIPFIEKTRTRSHSIEKPFPRQKLDLINHVFFGYNLVIKHAIISALPQHPQGSIPYRSQRFPSPFC